MAAALLLQLASHATEAPDTDHTQQTCSVKVSVERKFDGPAAAAGVQRLAGLDTCRRADGGGALVTAHFQLAEGAELLAELHEQLPPHNDPTGVLGPPGACADLVALHGCDDASEHPATLPEAARGSTLAELCPASCPPPGDDNDAEKAAAAAELLRSPLTQPAVGCGWSSNCPRAVLLSLPTGGPARSYLLRVYAAPAGSDGSGLPMVVELSLAVAPVPWRVAHDRREDGTSAAAGVALPRRSALLPTPFSAFAPRRAVLTTPLRRHLRIGVRYNFEVMLGVDAEAVALVPSQAVQPAAGSGSTRRPRWVHLARAEGIAAKDGVVRWRGSAVVKGTGGGLMLMARFASGDRTGGGNYDALVQFETTDDLQLVNGSTGVTDAMAWRTPVHIMSDAGDLGVRPLSHPHSEIILRDGPHLTMTLATKRAARLRVQTSTVDLVEAADDDDSDSGTCGDRTDESKQRQQQLGAAWEQPRVLVTHDAGGTEHTIYVHWDHPGRCIHFTWSSHSYASHLLNLSRKMRGKVMITLDDTI